MENQGDCGLGVACSTYPALLRKASRPENGESLLRQATACFQNKGQLCMIIRITQVTHEASRQETHFVRMAK